MLKDECALQVARAVQPRSQTKVTFEEGTHSSKQLDDALGSRSCHRNITGSI
jgi:hypothetical protein